MSELLGSNTKAVFFDWDDTLVATVQNKWEQHKHVARTWYGRELSDKDRTEHWGKPLPAMIRLLYGTEDIEEAIRFNHLVRADYPKILFEHSLRLIRHLRAAKKITGIVTAHTRQGFTQDLDELGIPDKLFDYTQTSDDTDFHKPDPRVFDPVLQWLADRDLQPSEATYVGDGLLDMKAANEAGLNFIGVETGLIAVEEFRSLGAIAVKDLSELIPSN